MGRKKNGKKEGWKERTKNQMKLYKLKYEPLRSKTNRIILI